MERFISVCVLENAVILPIKPLFLEQGFSNSALLALRIIFWW